MNITLSKSPTKKFKVLIENRDGRKKTIHFGAQGYEDYTIHKDPERKKRYIARHSKEDFTRAGIYKAGFWSRWILWNKPSLHESIINTEKKFGIKIHTKF